MTIPREHHLQAVAPVPEVGKRHDRLLAHAQHLAHQQLDAVDGLQGLRQDHVVEGVVLEQGEARFQVELQDVDVVAHAGEHFRVVDLHPVAVRLVPVPQVLEERAVAAAEIQHPRAGRDPLRDGLEVTTGERRFKVLVHLGNYALWLAGIFPQYIAARQIRSGGPDVSYYEQLGQRGFALASDHVLAEPMGLEGILRTASERFQLVRTALNGVSERVFFPAPGRLPPPAS